MNTGTRWLGAALVGLLVWTHPAQAQDQQSNCNWCEPCGLDGIKTCDMCATQYLIEYLAQPTCYTYSEGCGNLIPCQDREEEEVDELIASRDWARIHEFDKAHPGRFEFFAKRGVLLVREPCGRQIFAVLEVPKEQSSVFLKANPAQPE